MDCLLEYLPKDLVNIVDEYMVHHKYNAVIKSIDGIQFECKYLIKNNVYVKNYKYVAERHNMKKGSIGLYTKSCRHYLTASAMELLYDKHWNDNSCVLDNLDLKEDLYKKIIRNMVSPLCIMDIIY